MIAYDKNLNTGQSLFEIVLALALFALVASAFVSLTLGSVSSVSYGTDFLVAGAYADKGIGEVRATRDNAWNTLADGVTNETIDGRFTRAVTISPINLETKSIKSEVTWPSPYGVAQTVTRSTRLTNWDSRDWLETDWTGQTGTNVDVTTAGELKLAQLPTTWSLFIDTGAETWADVACTSASNCWAVGASGALARYNGSAWTESIIPSSANINALYALSASDIWAVGATGRLWHYDGSGWSLFIDTGAQTWNDVTMISATDGFIVGSGGNIRRWNNPTANVWNIITPVNTQNLNAVHCSSASNCFAVGASGTILRWTGATWSLFIDTGAQTWNDVTMISATDGFIVGSGGNIRRWNGSNWNTAPTSGTTQNLNAVHCSSASNCFAVGGTTAGTAGIILRWNGSTWSPYSPSPTTQILNSVFLSSPNDGWAVGGSGVILRLSGGGYETSGLLTSSIFDMTNFSPLQLVSWDEMIPACSPACSVKLNIKTATTSAELASLPWSPDFTLATGTLVPISYNGRQFAQYRVTLTGDGVATPVLQEVRINYK